MKPSDRKYCADCDYYVVSHSDLDLCNYAIMTGKCRSTICKYGVGCTCHSKYEEKKKKRRRSLNNKLGAIDAAASLGIHRGDYKKIDKTAALEMYRAGKNDVEIARVFNCTKGAVRFWRLAYGLPANVTKGNPNFKKQGGNNDAV